MFLPSVGLRCGTTFWNDGTFTSGRMITVPGQLRRVDLGDQFLERDDRRVLGAVRAGEEREHRTGLGAVRDRDRNRQSPHRFRPAPRSRRLRSGRATP